MEKIKNHLFNLVKITVFTAIVGLSVSKAQGVFITEIADPTNLAVARFVELHNNTSEDIDLTGWALRRWTNANTDPQSDKALQGVIPAGGFFIISPNGLGFENNYGFAASSRLSWRCHWRPCRPNDLR